MWERMDERTIFVDEFQDAASKDGDWLIIGKFTESTNDPIVTTRPYTIAEWSCGSNYK
jgi:hypothetical protein